VELLTGKDAAERGGVVLIVARGGEGTYKYKRGKYGIR